MRFRVDSWSSEWVDLDWMDKDASPDIIQFTCCCGYTAANDKKIAKHLASKHSYHEAYTTDRIETAREMLKGDSDSSPEGLMVIGRNGKVIALLD